MLPRLPSNAKTAISVAQKSASHEYLTEKQQYSKRQHQRLGAAPHRYDAAGGPQDFRRLRIQCATGRFGQGFQQREIGRTNLEFVRIGGSRPGGGKDPFAENALGIAGLLDRQGRGVFSARERAELTAIE